MISGVGCNQLAHILSSCLPTHVECLERARVHSRELTVQWVWGQLIPPCPQLGRIHGWDEFTDAKVTHH